MTGQSFGQVLETLIEKYPPLTRSGNPRWALGAGGAVSLLLSQRTIQDSEWNTITLQTSDCITRQEPVDLDVVVFRNSFGNAHKNRHDIVFLDGTGKAQVVDYETLENAGTEKKYIELVSKTYFGFPALPRKDDVWYVTWNGATVPVLSPEFLIASKLFSTRGTNQQKHVDDVVNLQERFNIDYDAVLAIGRKTPHKPILQLLGKDFKKYALVGKYHIPAYEYLMNKYGDILQQNPVGYNAAVSLLNFKPGALSASKDEEIHLEKFLSTFGMDSSSVVRAHSQRKTPWFTLAARYLLDTFFLTAKDVFEQGEPDERAAFRRSNDFWNKTFDDEKSGKRQGRRIAKLINGLGVSPETTLSRILEARRLSFKLVGVDSYSSKAVFGVALHLLCSHFFNVRACQIEDAIKECKTIGTILTLDEHGECLVLRKSCEGILEERVV